MHFYLKNNPKFKPRGHKPRSAPVLTSIDQGIVLHQMGKLQEAEIIYRDVLNLNPRNPDALHLLGLIELQNGKPENALTLIEKAIGVNNGNANYHFNCGVTLFQMRRLENALEKYKAALQIEHHHQNAMFMIIIC